VTLLAVVTCAALLGSIAGRVTDADSGAPVAGARVTLDGPGIAAADHVVVADREGRFRRDGLSPGRYQVSAAARGYVTASGEWRETVVLGIAEASRDVSFRLNRGAVVAGFITDDIGEPIVNLTMTLVASAGFGSQAIRADGYTAVSDDRGYYRFWGVRAGRYVVAARPTAAELATARADAAPAMSFYPGVQAPSQAEPVEVVAAAEVEGINFIVRTGRLSTLTIQVMNANGAPARNARVSINSASAGRANAVSAFPTGAAGHFVAPQMPAGDYRIVAAIGSNNTAVSYAIQPVAINGDGADVAVELFARAAAQLSGHLTVASGASPWPARATSVTSEAVSDAEPIFIVAPDGASPFSGAVRAGGVFSTAVLPGRRSIRVTGLPPGWAVWSITIDGRDVLEREVLFTSGDNIRNADIVVTDRLSIVAGTVADAGAGATAVIFSRDRTRWTPGARSVLRMPVDQQGGFLVPGVRPGEYFAAAVPREQSERLLDRRFLESLSTTAVVLDVRTGRSEPIALTISRPLP